MFVRKAIEACFQPETVDPYLARAIVHGGDMETLDKEMSELLADLTHRHQTDHGPEFTVRPVVEDDTEFQTPPPPWDSYVNDPKTAARICALNAIDELRNRRI
jgi:hypothetical protein